MAIDTLDPNLLSEKKTKQEKAPHSLASARLHKRILKVAAYTAIFLAALIFFFYLKTPKSLVQGIVLNSLNQGPMRWQAESIDFRLLFLPHLNAQKLSMESMGPSPLPPVTIEQVRVFPSLLSLLVFNPGASFDGRSYGAEFDGYFAPKKNALELDLKNADLSKITPLLEAGIDVKGIVTSLLADLSIENNRLSRLSGKIEASGKNFVLDPAALGIPIALPILDLGALALKGTAQDGKVIIESLQLGSPGKDLEMRITGDVTLADNPQMSRINLRLRLKPSEKILQAMPAIRTTLGTMGAIQPDGFYAMKMAGMVNGVILPTPDK